MTEPRLANRVAILEQKVEDLASLPDHVARVELQIVQLRDEMRLGFSAVRQEIRQGDDRVREDLRAEMRELRGELRGEMQRLRELRADIREGDQETRRYMRVLHEDVIARIAALGNARQ